MFVRAMEIIISTIVTIAIVIWFTNGEIPNQETIRFLILGNMLINIMFHQEENK